MELGLKTVFAAEVPSGERVVVEDTSDKSPIVSENGDIPSEECNLAIIEDLHLLLVPCLLVNVVDSPS